MNLGLASSANLLIERARGVIPLGTKNSSHQINCVGSAVDAFLNFGELPETDAQKLSAVLINKGLEVNVIKTAVQHIILQKDISTTDIDTVSRIFVSKKLRDKFSLWISKKPVELVSIKNTSNLEEKIIGDLMNNSVGSSQFKEWLMDFVATEMESGTNPLLPYRTGELCITSFGVFHQDGRQLYKPSTPCFRKNISGFSYGVVSYQEVEYQTISFYNGITRNQLLYDKNWNPILDTDVIKKVYTFKNSIKSLRDPSSPNSTGSAPSSQELSSAPAGSIVPEEVSPPQE